jgi:hypothetical protein
MPVVASWSGGFLDLDLLRLGPSRLGDFDPQDTFRHGGLDLRVPRFAAVDGPSRNRGRGLLSKGVPERMGGCNRKKRDSVYVSRRTRDLLKFKCQQEQEFVIGGYKDPGGNRIGFGALLLGFYRRGRLMYAGKVGTGFDHDMLQRAGRKLARLEMPNSPFGDEQVGGYGVHWSSQSSSLKSASLSGRGSTNCATLDSSACGTTRDRKRSCGKANVCSQRTSASIATHRRHLREWHGVPLQRLRPRQLPRLPA